MQKIQNILSYLEKIAPPSLQESYDNAGLIVGNAQTECTGVLTCLDSTEAVIEEAKALGCNLIVAHHPIVFRGLKRFNGKNYVERTVMSAIKNDIAIYAIHTNLDNVYWNGVNGKISEKLGLTNTRILASKQNLKKLSAIIPVEKSSQIRAELFEAGAGQVNNFKQDSFAALGVQSSPNGLTSQMKLEIVFPAVKKGNVFSVLNKFGKASPINYEVVSIENTNTEIGSGMIGELEKSMKSMDFLNFLKETMQVGCVKYTDIVNKKIKKVALCGGSGGFLLKHAIRQKADIFITADYKYHEFFDADGKIIIADIGHYESEQYTIELLYDLISQKFTTFATHFTKVKTNPVNYL